MNYSDAMKLAVSRADTGQSDLELLQRLIEERKDLEGSVVELGSFKCGSTMAMAQVTNKTVYAFDLFGGLPYGDQGAFNKFGNTDFEEIQSHICKFLNIRLIRGMHEDTVPKFAPQPLVLVFMDSDFYDSHRIGLSHLWPMVVPNGNVVFHDWTFDDVQRAIKDCINPKDCSYCGRLPESSMGMIQKIDLPAR